MGFYSFIVISPRAFAIERPFILLDRGMNAFNAVVDDLDALMKRFEVEGVEVKQTNKLDGLEPVPVSATLLLPGEEPEAPQLPLVQEEAHSR